jgi:hypothetical protein
MGTSKEASETQLSSGNICVIFSLFNIEVQSLMIFCPSASCARGVNSGLCAHLVNT